MWLLTARKSCIFSAFFVKKFAPFSLIFRPLLCILESRRQTHFPSGSSRGGSLGHSHFCTKTLLMSCVASQENYSYLCSLRILSLQGRIPLYSCPHLLKKTRLFSKKKIEKKSKKKRPVLVSPTVEYHFIGESGDESLQRVAHEGNGHKFGSSNLKIFLL